MGLSNDSFSVPNETYQCPDFLLMVTFLILPRTSCDFLNLTKPIPFGNFTRFPSIKQYLSNCTKRIESKPSDVRLNLGINVRNWISVPSSNLKNLGFLGLRLFSFKCACALGSKNLDQADARSRTFCCSDTALELVAKKAYSGFFLRSVILLTRLVALIN